MPDLAEAGTQLDGSAPRAATAAENNQARPPGAAFPGDDEGPSTGEGGQDAAGAGGGGR
ncbi:MAG: hypothetical protein LC733_07020 [Actinobacteria bacterium]|nr:hypothetical protein [Actinomycetota bacterium]